MEQVKPKLSMILMYAVIIWVLLSVISTILYLKNSEYWQLALLLYALLLVGSISLSLRVFLLPYFAIAVDEEYITGPSLFGVGWRRVKISLSEVIINPNPHRIKAFFGIYVIESTRGGKIGIWGFDEEQYEKLLRIVDDRSRFAAKSGYR